MLLARPRDRAGGEGLERSPGRVVPSGGPEHRLLTHLIQVVRLESGPPVAGGEAADQRLVAVGELRRRAFVVLHPIDQLGVADRLELPSGSGNGEFEPDRDQTVGELVTPGGGPILEDGGGHLVGREAAISVSGKADFDVDGTRRPIRGHLDHVVG